MFAIPILSLSCLIGAASPAALPANVIIERDVFGVPHITAPDREAAFYGVGYVTAQDRLFQLEMSRRMMRGRLSEIADTNQLDRVIAYDRRARLVGYGPHADSVAANLQNADVKSILEAFTQGVNDYVASLTSPPQAFLDSGITSWDPWVPGDCLLCFWRTQIAFDQKWLGELGASCPQGSTIIDLDGAIVDCPVGPPGCQLDLEGKSSAFSSYVDAPLLKASHGAVISGTKTTTGEALLLGEPRLRVKVPAVFYEYHVTTTDGEYNVRGMSPTGSVGMLVGFNESIAWTAASGGGEASDLYRLQLGNNGGYVVDLDGQGPNRPRELAFQDVRTEVIYSNPQRTSVLDTVEYKRTIWGPVVTEIYDACTPPADEYSLRTVYLDDTDRHSIVGMLEVMRSTDWCSTRAGLREYRGPSLQFLYADHQGHIGYQTLSIIPIRGSADACGAPDWGTVPQDGSTILADWQGEVSLDSLPWAYDPPEGYLVVGNNLAADPACVPFGLKLGMSGDTNRSWRMREAVEALVQAGPVDPVDFLAIHRDAVNPVLRVFIQMAELMSGLSPESQETLAKFSQWNDNLQPGEEYSAYLDIAYVDPVTQVEGDLSTLIYSLNRSINQTWRETPMKAVFGGGVPSGLCAGMKFADANLATVAANPDWIAWVDGLLSDSILYSDEDPLSLPSPEFQKKPVILYQTHLEPYCGSECLTQGALDCSWDSRNDFIPNRPLKCTMNNTIWSSLDQASSHFVDFSDVLGGAQSVVPPGQSDDPASIFFSRNEDEWITGSLNPAPLDSSLVPHIGPPIILVYP